MGINVDQPQKKERVEWLDVVKGIIIVLMLFGPNIQFDSGRKFLTEKLYFANTVFQLIYSFHMPHLMIISGYFFAFSITRSHFWKRKAQNTLIPTLAWSAIPATLSLASLNYAVAFGETVAVMVICVAGNWLIRRFSFTSKLFLGNRTE